MALIQLYLFFSGNRKHQSKQNSKIPKDTQYVAAQWYRQVNK